MQDTEYESESIWIMQDTEYDTESANGKSHY